MHRRRAILLIAAALPLLAVRPAPAAERPNIVLVMCDDLGWGDTGFNGGKTIRTPHLDEMAAAGMKFDRFYAAAPVCSPTRGSCLTGRHPYRYGVLYANTGHLRSGELTLAELLREQGYATGHFGKWHLGTLTRTEKDANRGGPRSAAHFAPPQQHGFDVCFSTESKVPTWDPLIRPVGQRSGTWWDPVPENETGEPYGTAYWNEKGERVTENTRGDDSRVIVDRVVPFLKQCAKQKRPFFAVVWFHTPHLPVVAGPKYTQMYAEHDKHEQHYYGCVTAMDEQVGRLRRTLRELGVAQNTLVTFCSDNGPEGSDKSPGSAGHLRGRKRSLFEGGVRVPGLMEWPARIEAGRVTDVPCVTSDYLPTIVEFVGAKLDGRADWNGRAVDGVSLVELIDGQMKERPGPIGFESHGQLALTGNRYKIIRAGGGKKRSDKKVEATSKGGKRKTADKREPPPFMLFDLAADPGESHDLAAEHPQIVAEMVETLEKWRASCRRSLEAEDYGE